MFGLSAVLLADPLRMFPVNTGDDYALGLLLLASLFLLGVTGAKAILDRWLRP